MEGVKASGDGLEGWAGLVSVGWPREGVPDPLDLWASAWRRGEEAVLWAHPAEGFWAVGVGAALRLPLEGDSPLALAREAHREVLRRAEVQAPDRPGVGPWFVAAFRFDPLAPRSHPWEGFPAGLLLLPRLTVARTPEGCWVTRNTPKGMGPAADGSWPRPPAARAPGPRRGSWEEAVREVVEGIRAGRWRKVTLARSLPLRSPTPWDPVPALRRLWHAYPTCRVFALAWKGACFLGASPELLASLRRGRVLSLCLAGSAPRGSTPEEDRRLGEALLRDPKERWEHELVAGWVAERLRPHCPDLTRDEAPFLLRLETVQHLATAFTGRARPGAHLLDLVEGLHPTPAVAGVPVEEALRAIRSLEGMDRGWYAGPVGWLDRHGEGEFSLAIRSALLLGREAFLYAGAGIVEGSDPERERRETDLKLQALLKALGQG